MIGDEFIAASRLGGAEEFWEALTADERDELRRVGLVYVDRNDFTVSMLTRPVTVLAPPRRLRRRSR